MLFREMLTMFLNADQALGSVEDRLLPPRSMEVSWVSVLHCGGRVPVSMFVASFRTRRPVRLDHSAAGEGGEVGEFSCVGQVGCVGTTYSAVWGKGRWEGSKW